MTNHPWLVPESRRPADRLIINDNYLLASMMCPTHLDVDNGCAYHVDNCRAFARRMRKIALRSLLLKFTAKDQPPNQPFAILSQFRRQESPSIAGSLMPGSLLRVVSSPWCRASAAAWATEQISRCRLLACRGSDGKDLWTRIYPGKTAAPWRPMAEQPVALTLRVADVTKGHANFIGGIPWQIIHQLKNAIGKVSNGARATSKSNQNCARL